MVTFRTATAIAGEVYALDDPRTVALDKTAAALAKGELLAVDTANNKYFKCPDATTKGPYAVAIKDAAAADLKVFAITKPWYVTVTTSSTLDPTDRVKPSATAGQVQRFVEGTDDDLLLVGEYVGRVANLISDYGGQVASAQAAAASVVLIRLAG